MIPYAGLIFLVVLGSALMVYAFIDNRSHLYGNIAALGLAMLIFFLAGYMTIGGIVYDTDPATLVQDRATGYLFVLMGIVALIFLIIHSLDALTEYQMFKREAKERAFYGDDQP